MGTFVQVVALTVVLVSIVIVCFYNLYPSKIFGTQSQETIRGLPKMPAPPLEMTSRNLETDLQPSLIDWEKRFKFVPYHVQNCSQLFGGKNNELSPSLITSLDQYAADYKKIVSSVAGVRGVEGYTAQVPEAFNAYIEIVSHPSVKTICETGFNAGHSAFSWLVTNLNAQVYSFDIGVHAYSRPMADHIKNLYPDRFHITWGNSMETLPEFHRKYPNVICDVLIIDGGHSATVCRSDFINFRNMSSVNNVLILDNYPQKSWNFMGKLGGCWERPKRNAHLAEIFNCVVQHDTWDFGCSVGRIITE
jgi:hypothetical protein